MSLIDEDKKTLTAAITKAMIEDRLGNDTQLTRVLRDTMPGLRCLTATKAKSVEFDDKKHTATFDIKAGTFKDVWKVVYEPE